MKKRLVELSEKYNLDEVKDRIDALDSKKMKIGFLDLMKKKNLF